MGMESGFNREKPRPAKIDAAILLNDKKMLSDAGKLGAMKTNKIKEEKRSKKEELAQVEEEHKRERDAEQYQNLLNETGENKLPSDPDNQKEE